MVQRFSYAKGGKLVLHTFYVGTLLSFYFDTVSFVDKERYIYNSTCLYRCRLSGISSCISFYPWFYMSYSKNHIGRHLH